jgi:hypothetical protein
MDEITRDTVTICALLLLAALAMGVALMGVSR